MIRVPSAHGKTVLVVGLGKSGAATARALVASGAKVIAWDDNAERRAEAGAAGMTIIDPVERGLDGIDMIVWSPGIPHSHPQPHAIAQAAAKAGIALVCDIELLAQAKPACRFIGITGTNGKSTTTTLVAHILKTAGISFAVGGNLGMAALSLDDLAAGGLYVLELSSYQLELAPSLRLDTGALLNITPDHLARHGGMDGYVAAKRNLLMQTGGTAIVGIDDAPSRALCEDFRAVPISAVQSLDHGVSAADGVLAQDGRKVCDLNDIKTLPGRHNWQNAAAAFALCRAVGLSEQAIVAGLQTYPGLAHRQELVAVANGILYVNDSKATNADATEKALVCYDRIYWILGGQAKEGGIAPLAPHFSRIAHAFLIGEAAQDFAAILENGKVPHQHCGVLDVALRAAHDLAQAEAIAGSAVLLSPACASWDQFKSFEHRGDCFRDGVLALTGGRAA